MPDFNPHEPYDLPNLEFNDDLLTRNVLLELVEARAAIAELKGSNSEVHNPYALISPPALIKEAMTSNAIENIHTTIDSVMQDAVSPAQMKREANKEVLNYRNALIKGFFSKLPVATRLFLQLHKDIIPEVGGRYRQQQNAIKNVATDETIYTPPRASRVSGLMGGLENFLHNEDKADPLVKAVMGHYQFEAIHPFSDGNGRVGRISFVLYLVEQELLQWPVLFLSGYLLSNRDEYYRRLLEVTSDGKWEEYLVFMLKGISLQAQKTIELSRKALATSRMLEDKIKDLPGHVQAGDLVKELFWFPYINASLLAEQLGIAYTTATAYLKRLEEAGIVTDLGKKGRYHVYVCNDIRSLYD